MDQAVEITSMDDGRNVKCPRCWHWHSVVENYDNLCDQCQKIILTDYPSCEAAIQIASNLEQQRMKYAR